MPGANRPKKNKTAAIEYATAFLIRLNSSYRQQLAMRFPTSGHHASWCFAWILNAMRFTAPNLLEFPFDIYPFDI